MWLVNWISVSLAGFYTPVNRREVRGVHGPCVVEFGAGE
jgi:hypothetical protein